MKPNLDIKLLADQVTTKHIVYYAMCTEFVSVSQKTGSHELYQH